ncbi:MAG: hypothetical protein ABIK15_16795 [Pseudomonadota bacterium]
MSSNFHIEVRKTNDNLHIILKGDFDGNSAWELVNLLDKHCKANGKVIIDTRYLGKIYAFGCNIFRNRLNRRVLPPSQIVFRGESAGQIAVEGSCVETAHPNPSCRCDGKCRQCMCMGELKHVEPVSIQ